MLIALVANGLSTKRACWSEHTALYLFSELVCSLYDLPNLPPRMCETPVAELAAALILRELAKGLMPSRQILVIAAAAGIRRGVMYRAKNRLGIPSADGVWRLQDS